MKKMWMIPLVPGCILGAFVVFVLALLVLKLLWVWTIPDLFPGAVQQGLIAREISWLTSLKLAIFVTVLAAVAGLNGRLHRGDK